MTQNVEDTLPLKPLNFNKRIQVFYKVCTYSAGVFVKISSLSESIITSSMSSTTSTILENVQSIWRLSSAWTLYDIFRDAREF